MSNRQIVKQDFKLVNAKYKLTTNEIKIIMNAISEIKIEDKDFHTYKIKLSDISQELHNESLKRSYTRLKNFCEDLLKKPLFIPKEDKGFLVVNWFSSLEYIAGTAEIEYDIHPKLKPYLLELKERFVQYNLKYILPLASSYSIRIYQLLKEYEKATKRTFTVNELMDILQVPTSYKIYNRFKEKVLQVAEKELIAHCDIFFEYEEIKEGKRVNEILFRIKKNHWLQEEAKDNQGTFKETLIDAELMQYIGKTIYQNGYDWKIISISKNKNLYSIFCHEETDSSYTKTFEVSEVQLKAAK